MPGFHALAESMARFGTSSLVLALFLPLTLITRRSVQRFLMALVILDIPLRLEHHFGSHESSWELGSFGGLGISVTTLGVAVLYAAWIVESVVGVGRSRPPLRYDLPLATYVLVSAFSLLVARDILFGFFEVWILFQTFLVFVYFANKVQSREDVLFVVRIFLIALVVESTVILGLAAGLRFDIPGHPLVVAEEAVGQYSRIAGTVSSPNVAAGYLTLLMTPALSLLAAPLGRWDKRLALLAFGSAFVALVFTFSRGAWTALLLSLAIMGGVLLRQRRLRLTTLVVFILGIAAIGLILHHQIATRLLMDDRGAGNVRFDLMRVAFSMIRDHPLLGVGANNYPLVMGRYYKAGEWVYSVHDKYLLVGAEIGILGLLAFLGFLLGTIRRGMRLWRAQDPLISALAIGVTAAVIGHMTHLFVDVFRGRVAVQLLWMMAALVVALSRIEFAPRATTIAGR